MTWWDMFRILTNRAMAMPVDTVMFAEEMNQYHQLGPELQYDFYYYGVRKGRRFGFPKKPDDNPQLELVQEFFGYSKQKGTGSTHGVDRVPTACYNENTGQRRQHLMQIREEHLIRAMRAIATIVITCRT